MGPLSKKQIMSASPATDELSKFLEIIEMLESSQGKDFGHRTMESGIHEGHAAAGRYGLMPNTALEVINRLKRQQQISPEMEALQKMSPDEIKQKLESDRILEEQIARGLAGRVLERQGGDLEKAAYSWQYGHNLTPEKIEETPYKDNFYVQRFNKTKKLIDNKE